MHRQHREQRLTNSKENTWQDIYIKHRDKRQTTVNTTLTMTDNAVTKDKHSTQNTWLDRQHRDQRQITVNKTHSMTYNTVKDKE